MADNAIVLCSGGFDSVVTAHYVRPKVKDLIILFIDYDQRVLKEEEFCARKCAEDLKAEFVKIDMKWLNKISTSLINDDKDVPVTKDVDLGKIEKEKDEILLWWIPCRNSLFLNCALAHAESKYLSEKKRYDVYIGLKNEGKIHMKDTTQEFVDAFNKLCEEATHDGGYKVLAPFIKKDKDEITKIGDELKVDHRFTYSCYKGEGIKEIPVHCGYCNNCVIRKKAFYWSGIKDPSIYLK